MHWTRRDFVKRSAAGLAAGLAGGPSALRSQSAQADFRVLRGDVGIYINRGGTIGWINTLYGCALVDSQFADTTEALLVELREIGCRPVHALVNTHHHADHTGGNRALRYVVRDLVAHENSVVNQRNQAQQNNTEADQEYPDTTFSETWTLPIGGETMRAKYYGPAHTNGDITVFFENADIVHMGDLVNNGGYPNIDGPAGGSVQGWIRALETIVAEHSANTLYIFGHNDAGRPVTGGSGEVLRQRDYLSAVLDAARSALQQGRTRDQVTATSSLSGFTDLGGSANRLGLALGVAYDELSGTPGGG